MLFLVVGGVPSFCLNESPSEKEGKSRPEAVLIWVFILPQ